MKPRYQATLMKWNRRTGQWVPCVLGVYRTRFKAARRLYQESRNYTRFERHTDYGEVLDLKTGCYEESSLDVRYNVPTVGDLGWTP